MSRAALFWLDGGRPRVADLAESGTCTIGRAAGSTVDLSDAANQQRYGTVSRRHAEVRSDGGVFTIAHTSQTNPTRVNGEEVATGQPRRLADHDVIALGGLQLTFHDLATGDHLSGIICPTCGRENEASRHDCWYDGTNLATAISISRHLIRVAGRFISSDGHGIDLWRTQEYAANGLRVNIDERGPWLSSTASDSVSVNGHQLPAAGQLLHSGDVVRASQQAYVIVLR